MDIIEILQPNSTFVIDVITNNTTLIDATNLGGSGSSLTLPTYTVQGESGLDPEVGTLPLTNTTGRTMSLRNVRVQFSDEATSKVLGQSLIVDVRKGATSIFAQPTLRPTIGVGASTASYDFPDVLWVANEGLYVDLAQAPTNAGRCKVIVQLWAD
jgi:hypothetical protein